MFFLWKHYTFQIQQKISSAIKKSKGGKSKLMPIFITYCNKTVFMNSINMICVCVSARTHINFKTFPWLNIPRLVCKSVYKTLPHCLLTALPSSTLLHHTTQNLELLPYFMTFIPCSPLVEGGLLDRPSTQVELSGIYTWVFLFLTMLYFYSLYFYTNICTFCLKFSILTCYFWFSSVKSSQGLKWGGMCTCVCKLWPRYFGS